MPYDDAPPRPSSTAIAPSAAIELSWLVATCHREELALPTTAELFTRADAFWNDGCGLGIELLVMAQQLGCLTGWDVAPLFSLGDVRVVVPPALGLESETEEDRAITIARLERLGRDRRLRTRYSTLLRDLWTVATPAWTTLGRPSVERAMTRMQASLDHGLGADGLIPPKHIAQRSEFQQLVAAASTGGSLVVTPAYFARQKGHIVALPGLLSVAVGAGVTTDMAKRRNDAERIAAGLKLLSDATRIVILDELDRQPATVGETAQRVGIAQPTASAHLRQLRDAGLIEAHRDGQRTVYRVQRDHVERVIDQAREWMLPASTRDTAEPNAPVSDAALALH